MKRKETFSNCYSIFLLYFQYNCIDSSYLSRYIMHPFWNYCVQVILLVHWSTECLRNQPNNRMYNYTAFFQFFPRWMAPNLITFIGFLLTVANFLLIGYFDYSFTAANSTKSVIPSWVWILAAANIFIAYTLGKNNFYPLNRIFSARFSLRFYRGM